MHAGEEGDECELFGVRAVLIVDGEDGIDCKLLSDLTYQMLPAARFFCLLFAVSA